MFVQKGKCKMKVWQVTLKLNLISELKWATENRDLEEGAKLVVEGYKATIECNELDGEFVAHKDCYRKVDARWDNPKTKIPKGFKITDYGSSINITVGVLHKPNDEQMKAIQELMAKLNEPTTIKDCGISEEEFFSKIDMLADRAFEDQCTGVNPRVPLVSEIKEILTDGYYGNEIKF